MCVYCYFCQTEKQNKNDKGRFVEDDSRRRKSEAGTEKQFQCGGYGGYCGIRQRRGRKVVIGVNNKSKIVGVDINSESVQNWVNEIKSKTEPAIVVDANQFELDGKTVVILSVSEYPIKPIAIQGRYFKSVQNSNHQLSAMEIANLSLHSLQVSWDSYPAYGKIPLSTATTRVLWMSKLRCSTTKSFSSVLANCTENKQLRPYKPMIMWLTRETNSLRRLST